MRAPPRGGRVVDETAAGGSGEPPMAEVRRYLRTGRTLTLTESLPTMKSSSSTTW